MLRMTLILTHFIMVSGARKAFASASSSVPPDALPPTPIPTTEEATPPPTSPNQWTVEEMDPVSSILLAEQNPTTKASDFGRELDCRYHNFNCWSSEESGTSGEGGLCFPANSYFIECVGNDFPTCNAYQGTCNWSDALQTCVRAPPPTSNATAYCASLSARRRSIAEEEQRCVTTQKQLCAFPFTVNGVVYDAGTCVSFRAAAPPGMSREEVAVAEVQGLSWCYMSSETGRSGRMLRGKGGFFYESP